MGPGPEQEKDPLLLVKHNFNRWSQATHHGEQGHATRLDLVGEPGVMKNVQQSLERGDLGGFSSAAQAVLGERMKQRTAEVRHFNVRLDGTEHDQIQRNLANDAMLNGLRHQREVLAGGDISPLAEEGLFDETMQFLNEQERTRRTE